MNINNNHKWTIQIANEKVEYNKLYKEEKIIMLYHFKTELEAQQYDIRKFEDDYDIDEHLDYTKPYGYVCDWCRED